MRSDSASFSQFRFQEGGDGADHEHANDNFKARFQDEGKKEGRNHDAENYQWK